VSPTAGRIDFASVLWPAACVAAGYALTLDVFYPGIMNYDARYVYQDSLKGEYGDWQSPVMTWLWALIDPLAPGSASMFLLIVSVFWLAVLVLALAIKRQSIVACVTLCILALSPPLFALLGVIWRDILLAGVWLLAAALVYASQSSTAGWRIVCQSSAIALIAFGVLLRPNAIAAAPLLITLAAWPSRFQLKRTILTFIPVMLGLFALVQLTYYSALNAKRQNPLHSIMMFDLGGISHFSKQNRFPVEWSPTEQDALLNRCYDALMWNVYWNGDCKFVMAKIEGERAIFGTSVLTRAWAEAVIQHPLAYIRHRLSFFWTFLAGQNLGMWTQDIERPSHTIFDDRPAFKILRRIHDALQPTLLFRIGTWLLLNLAVCLLVWRRRHTPEGAFAIGVCGSAALYILSFLPLGVAAEFRYGYWAVLAGIAGTIVAILPGGRPVDIPRS
jgi:hypothetical protein